MLFLVLQTSLPKSFDSVSDFIIESFIPAGKVGKGDLEVEPISLTREQEEEFEYAIYTDVLKLIDKSKYDDIQVTYTNQPATDDNAESTTLTFFRHGIAIDELQTYWYKKNNALVTRNADENRNPETKTDQPFLEEERRNAIIEAIMPYYGKRIVEEDKKRTRWF